MDGPFRAEMAGDLGNDDDPAPEQYVVMRGETYVCSVHGYGLFSDDATGEETARVIAGILNAHYRQ